MLHCPLVRFANFKIQNVSILNIGIIKERKREFLFKSSSLQDFLKIPSPSRARKIMSDKVYVSNKFNYLEYNYLDCETGVCIEGKS